MAGLNWSTAQLEPRFPPSFSCWELPDPDTFTSRCIGEEIRSPLRSLMPPERIDSSARDGCWSAKPLEARASWISLSRVITPKAMASGRHVTNVMVNLCEEHIH